MCERNFHPILAVSAAVVEKGRILLVKRGVEPNKGLWSLPGGSVEFGETISDALIREVAEETSIVVAPGEFITFHEVISGEENATKYHYVVIVMGATRIGGNATAGSDAAEVGWYTAREIEMMPTTNGLRKVVAHIGGLV